MAYVFDLRKRKAPLSIGNKARNLHRLSHMGIRIPETLVVSWRAYHDYLDDKPEMIDALRTELDRFIDPDEKYAVRSSASIEDSSELSFAGQFKSVLDVQGIDNMLMALWAIWATAQSDRVNAYIDKNNNDDRLSMAVIVQQMIQPEYGGVALSRNPVTGADEVVVEAVEGSGEALVQSGFTPMRWINKWDTWLTQPETEIVPLEIMEQIVRETRLISQKWKSHIDLEWVYDGRRLYWVQAREITTLNQQNVYSNHIPKEMIPGMIKPLIGSVNIPLVCSMWIRLLTEMVGKLSVQPEDLARPFYYRVYFNMGTLGQIFQEVGLPSDSVEMLTGVYPDDIQKPKMMPTWKTILRLPQVVAFLIDKWFFSRRLRKKIPGFDEAFQSFDYENAITLSDAELIAEIDRLYALVQDAAYYNIVGPLLAMMYNRMLKSALAKDDIEFSDFELLAGVEELTDYDPTYHLHRLHDEIIQLPPDVQASICDRSYDQFLTMPGISDFRNKFFAFVQKFGFLSDNGNDFSSIPWRETPEMVLDLILNFTPSSETGAAKTRVSDLEIRGLRKWKFMLFYRRAREYHLLREQIGKAYNFGYGLFRYYYLALGAHFVDRGILDQPEDIFYLKSSEVRQIVEEQKLSFEPRTVVSHHKMDIERYTHIKLPTVIYGDKTPPVEDATMSKLVGVPTSIGHYTGKVTTVTGIRDFYKVDQGDVLVIPYSDVGWTPLFARAGAVVAESGGMLSHSSIIAREYDIPAIVSVDGAMQLSDGSIVTVNGHSGEVLIHAQEKVGGLQDVRFGSPESA